MQPKYIYNNFELIWYFILLYFSFSSTFPPFWFYTCTTINLSDIIIKYDILNTKSIIYCMSYYQLFIIVPIAVFTLYAVKVGHYLGVCIYEVCNDDVWG